MSATSAARKPPGRRSPDDQPELRIDRERTGAIVAVAAHARTSHGLTTTDQICGVQRRLGGITEAPREIADHGDSPATAGVDDGIHGPGVEFVPAPGAREQTDPAVSRQRLTH